MNELLRDAAERASAYLEGLDARSVAPDRAAIAALDALDVPLPRKGSDDASVIAELDALSPATMAMAGPRFFGFVIGGALPVTLAANWIAGAWDQNSAYFNATPATARL
jgi:glutamate/tyrosine decarboxylase-like PLP-dependent enzyme